MTYRPIPDPASSKKSMVLPMSLPDLTLLEREECGLEEPDPGLDQLDAAALRLKHDVLGACFAADR